MPAEPKARRCTGVKDPIAWGDLLMPFAEAGGKSWIKYNTWDKLEEAQLEQTKMQKMWPIVHAIEENWKSTTTSWTSL